MKKKIFLSILIIFSILSLIGCMPTIPGESIETIVEEEVRSYWKAIINRQYELAKWYCIPDGVWYNKTDEWEEYINTNTEGEASLIISGPVFHKETEVIGEDIYDPDIRDEAITYVTIDTYKKSSPDGTTTSSVFKYEIGVYKQDKKWKLK
ncbi:MAG: hypothetical protein ACOWWR_01595 [Eubacteriales bacterium]